MGNFRNKKYTKIVSWILILLIVFISIIPNHAIASAESDDEEAGGTLFRPVFKLFAGVGDLVMKTMQYYFYADFDIKDDKDFEFKYGPAAIFSGIVPGLDANFISPSKNIIKGSYTVTDYTSLIDALELNKAKEVFSKQYSQSLATKKGIIKDIKNDSKYGYSEDRIIDKDKLEGKLKSSESSGTVKFAGSDWNNTQDTLEEAWINGDKSKVYVIVDVHWSDNIGSQAYVKLFEIDTKDALNNSTKITDTITETKVETENKGSTAKALQGTIATWYKALRLIALVGLLSVLVYVGIRIIISSTGQEKAKYKKMIVDWIAAICILFVLQYIMAFTMNIVDDILSIFNENDKIIENRDIDKDGTITDPGTDVLLSSIRGKVNTSGAFSEGFADLIIYLVLVIYTVIFTVHYLKRLVYLAFFTMIAPLIALTYPLDKIKDRTSTSIWNVDKRICI